MRNQASNLVSDAFINRLVVHMERMLWIIFSEALYPGSGAVIHVSLHLNVIDLPFFSDSEIWLVAAHAAFDAQKPEGLRLVFPVVDLAFLLQPLEIPGNIGLPRGAEVLRADVLPDAATVRIEGSPLCSFCKQSHRSIVNQLCPEA